MKRRKLGSEGLEVSALGLGCMGMSEFYGPADKREAKATLRRAVELGVDLFDTADIYGPFTNERLLGEVLVRQRANVKIATKFGIVRDENGALVGTSGSPEYVHSACDASLSRLGMDVIDLYYLHRVDPQVPIEETVGAMGELVLSGKVRYLGLSEVTSAEVRRAHAVRPISAVQSEYSLWSRDPEEDVLATLNEIGIGFVAYCPLGRGFLSGRVLGGEAFAATDIRSGYSPRFEPDNLAQNRHIAEEIAQLAEEEGISSAQLVLAWLLAQGENIVPIPGSRRRGHLEENVVAADVDLSPRARQRLEEIAPRGIAVGDRYPDMERMV